MSAFSTQSLTTLLHAMGLIASVIKPIPLIGDALPLLGDIIEGAIGTNGTLGIQSVAGNGMRTANCPSVEAYEKSVVPLEEFAPFDLAVSNVYRYRQQQSVNLGSWFAQEAWMHPSLFACASGNKSAEFDVAAGFDGNLQSAQWTLEKHWDEWITEDDFAYLQNIGINTVRLPIGYWSLGPDYVKNTPFEKVSSVYANSWPRIVRSINWAAKHGLGVLVDMHGAPGSQNGQAHSGMADGVVGFFDSKDYQDSTICALTFLTEHLANVTNVVGIEILNEPVNDPRLPEFYTRAINQLRTVSPAASSFPFYIHDAFDLPMYADFVANRTDFVVVDHHQYFVFAPQDPNESTTHLSAGIRETLSASLRESSTKSRNNVIIGEWSDALSQQSLAKETNPVGARQNYSTGQMLTYSNVSAGWSFWSYKTESCDTDDDWCFRNAVGKSLPASFFSFPGAARADSLPTARNSSNASDVTSLSSALLDLLEKIDLPPLANILANITLDFAAPSVPTKRKLAQEAVELPLGKFTVRAWRERVRRASAEQTKSTSPKSIPGKFQVRSLREEAASLGRRNQTVSDDSGADTLPLAKTPLSNSTVAESSSSSTMSVEESAIAKGYSDGFQTAKFFALTQGSKLSFSAQYICDSLWALGEGSIGIDQHDHYKTSFLTGLTEGENEVRKAIANAPLAGSSRRGDLASEGDQVDGVDQSQDSQDDGTDSNGDDETAETYEHDGEDYDTDSQDDDGPDKPDEPMPEDDDDSESTDDVDCQGDMDEDTSQGVDEAQTGDQSQDSQVDNTDSTDDTDSSDNIEVDEEPKPDKSGDSNTHESSSDAPNSDALPLDNTSSASNSTAEWDSGLLDDGETLSSLWDRWSAKTIIGDRVALNDGSGVEV